MIIGEGGGGINNEAKGGFCDSQKSLKGDITYFVKESEESSEKIYINWTHERIPGPSQK